MDATPVTSPRSNFTLTSLPPAPPAPAAPGGTSVVINWTSPAGAAPPGGDDGRQANDVMRGIGTAGRHAGAAARQAADAAQRAGSAMAPHARDAAGQLRTAGEHAATATVRVAGQVGDAAARAGAAASAAATQEAQQLVIEYYDRRFPQAVDVAIYKQDRVIDGMRRSLAAKDSSVYQVEHMIGSMEQRLGHIDARAVEMRERGLDTAGLEAQRAATEQRAQELRLELDHMKAQREQFGQQLVALQAKAAGDRDAAAILKMHHAERVELDAMSHDARGALDRIIALDSGIRRIEQSQFDASANVAVLLGHHVPTGAAAIDARA